MHPLDTLLIILSAISFSVNCFNCPIFPWLGHDGDKNWTIRNILRMLPMTIMTAQLVPENPHLTMKIPLSLKLLHIGEEHIKMQPSEQRENQGVINGLVRHRCQSSCQMLAYTKSEENWI